MFKQIPISVILIAITLSLMSSMTAVQVNAHHNDKLSVSTTTDNPSSSSNAPSSTPNTPSTDNTPSSIPSTPSPTTTPTPPVTPTPTPVVKLCSDGSHPDKDGKCPTHLPENCKKVDNGTVIFCRGETHTRTIVHNTIQQVPVTSTDINLFIVTSCTSDFNNGQLKGDLATLCDTSITMMHNEGLNSQLPQVDMYLKSRGLL